MSQAAHALGHGVRGDDRRRRPTDPARADRGGRSHVIVIGRPLRPGALSHVAQRIADVGRQHRIGHPAVHRAGGQPRDDRARARPGTSCAPSLVQAAEDTGVDIAVEPAGLRRRAKRLVVLDVDSTLIRDEAIDVLAERAGVGAEVAAITDPGDGRRARLRRVAAGPGRAARRADLEPISRRCATRCRSPRARARSSARCAAWATTSAWSAADSPSSPTASSTSSGSTSRPRTSSRSSTAWSPAGSSARSLDRAGKAAALRRFAEEFGVPLAQTVAVGDGANDIDMLEAAGLGVAFNAKSALRAAADTVGEPALPGHACSSSSGISGDDVARSRRRPCRS